METESDLTEVIQDRTYEEVIDSVMDTLVEVSHNDDQVNSESKPEEFVLKSILKKPKKRTKELSDKTIQWADEVDSPLVTEHEVPHWNRRPNFAMFRFDLARTDPSADLLPGLCFSSPRSMMIVALVVFVIVGAVALTLLFKLLGYIRW